MKKKTGLKSQENKVIFNVLSAFSKVANALAGSKLQVENLKSVQEDFENLMEYLSLNEIETMLFTAVLFQQKTYGINTHEISEFFGLESLEIMKYRPALEKLTKIRFLINGSNRGNNNFLRMEYEIADRLIRSISTNSPIKRQIRKKQRDNYSFVSDCVRHIHSLSRRKMHSIEEIIDEVESLEGTYGNMKFINFLKNTLNRDEARIIFYLACANDMQGDKTFLNESLRDLYDDSSELFYVNLSMVEKRHELVKKELIEVDTTNFFNNAVIRLSEKGRELFYGEDVHLMLKGSGGAQANIISPEKITHKELYFSPNQQKEIEFLTKSLQNERLIKLEKRMKDSGFSTSVNCLFYGTPGTGKTELAKQLARTTGRKLLHVDISSTKSKWFGQSEKEIKKVFDRYAKMIRHEEVKPILLFNEADAVFTQRRSNNEHSQSTDQTLNAIQNIILEEMEKIEGILIATTNFSNNFDNAFERRFLFKIKFEKPNIETKKAIWKSKLDWLTDSEAEQLADSADLSGGEIDNIVRKSIMDEVNW